MKCRFERETNQNTCPAQVETQLKTKSNETKAHPRSDSGQSQDTSDHVLNSGLSNSNSIEDDILRGISVPDPVTGFFDSISQKQDGSSNPGQLPEFNSGFDDGLSWEMIGLGLEEPLPTLEAMEEL